MLNKVKISFTIVDFLEECLAFLLVLNCNSVYQRLAFSNLYIEEIIAVISFLLLVVCSKGKINIDTKTRNLIEMLLLVVGVYFFVMFSSSSISDYTLHFFIFLPCIIIFLSIRKNTLGVFQKFATIVFFISTVSTIVWFFAEIIPVLSHNMSVVIAWGENHSVNGFFGVFFECQRDTTFGLGKFYRNSGIYCEAPMHSLVLSLTLIYELFLSKSVSKKKVVLLCLYIITTVSSTGILCIMFCGVLYYWRIIQGKKKNIRIICTMGLILLIPILYLAVNLLLNIKSTTGSYTIRMIDYVAGVMAWKDHPLFGVGYNYLGGLLEYSTKFLIDAGFKIDDAGFSNSLMAILGQGGLCLFVLYLLPFVKIIFTKGSKSNIGYKYWSIVLMSLFTTTIFHARFIMIYFIALGYVLAFDLSQK